MKNIKNYDNFSEEYRLNENLLKKAWGAVVGYFKRHFGIHAWIYYALYLQKNGKLPSKKVELICPPSYITKNVPSKSDIENDEERSERERDIESRFSKLEGKLNEADVANDFIKLTHPNPNVRNVNVEELKERIKLVYDMNALRATRHKKDKYSDDSEYIRKKNHALFIWGAPGIGKTEILHQLAKTLNLAVLEWHLATIEPTDFRGIPKVENIIKGSTDPKDERSVTKLPAIFPTSDGENENGGIMFFDELNRADNMVLSASLALALSGKHGEYSLPPKWIVIAAGNRPDDIQGKLTDDAILWNRFGHVNYVPTVENWISYAKNLKDINPDLIEFFKDAEGKDYYHQLSPEKGRPNWPSPRTWEMASQEEYFERAENWKNRISTQEIFDIYEDLVGFNAAKKFSEFVEKQEIKRRKEEEEKRLKERSKMGGPEDVKNRKGMMGKEGPDDLDTDLELPAAVPAKKVTKPRAPRTKKP